MPAKLRVPVLTVDELEDAVAVHGSEQGSQARMSCFSTASALSARPSARPMSLNSCLLSTESARIAVACRRLEVKSWGENGELN